VFTQVVEGPRQQCGTGPQKVSADSGFYSDENLRELERRQIDGSLPDPNTSYDRVHRLQVQRRSWHEPAH